MVKTFLIKYSEIALKGKNRYVFEEVLVKQIKTHLKKAEGEFEVRRTQGRIYVDALTDYDYDETVDALQHVFGIVGICPMEELEDDDFDGICAAAVKHIDDNYPDKHITFKVFARRARKNYFKNSMEIGADVGEAILKAFPEIKVDVHNPDVTLFIEIRENVCLYSKIIPGAGGMPIGTGGKAMLLLSGGIDSPVAGYMIAKRGVLLEAVYFNAPPYTSERAKQKVIDLAKKVAAFSGPIKLHVINFTDIQLYIYDKCEHDELTIIMRRYMMRIAQILAEQSECLGLITGESIGQVASQTMQSLACTDAVCHMPVYRPVIAYDKNDIIAISEKIDTYDISIQPYEDCCTIFVAKHPVTKPKLDAIEKHEHNLDEDIDRLVQVAVETDEIINVRGDE